MSDTGCPFWHKDGARKAVGAGQTLTLDGAASAQKEREVVRLLTAHPMVRSVYRVSGEDCFVADVACRRIEDVSDLLAQLKQTRVIQSSRTAFVLEPVLDRRGFGPLDPSLVGEEA